MRSPITHRRPYRIQSRAGVLAYKRQRLCRAAPMPLSQAVVANLAANVELGGRGIIMPNPRFA